MLSGSALWNEEMSEFPWYSIFNVNCECFFAWVRGDGLTHNNNGNNNFKNHHKEATQLFSEAHIRTHSRTHPSKRTRKIFGQNKINERKQIPYSMWILHFLQPSWVSYCFVLFAAIAATAITVAVVIVAVAATISTLSDSH